MECHAATKTQGISVGKRPQCLGMVSQELGLLLPQEATGSAAQLKCIYTNTHGMGNKQKELEAIAPLENCDILANTETWWDNLHNWTTVTVAAE